MACHLVLKLHPHVDVLVLDGCPSRLAKDMRCKVDNVFALQASQSQLRADSKEPPLVEVPECGEVTWFDVQWLELGWRKLHDHLAQVVGSAQGQATHDNRECDLGASTAT